METCGIALIEHREYGSTEEMLGRMRIDEVFTREEQIRSGRGSSLQHWAGRLAAKQAVLRLIGVPTTASWMQQAQVLPAPTRNCEANHKCMHGHPPSVVFGPELELAAVLVGIRGAEVSITHTERTAMAIALAVTGDRSASHDRPQS